MYRILLLTGVLGISLMVLPACQSMTGKTAGQTMDDASVTAAVQGKLTADKLSNFARIDVDTERGTVSLNGVVRSEDEKIRAADLARQVSGVMKVHNNLQIQSSMNTPNP